MTSVVPMLTYDTHFINGKNVLVTGCTSGIGKAIVTLLGTGDYNPNKIFLACRSQGKGDALQEELKQVGVSCQMQVLVGDMGTMAGTKMLADAMLATQQPLHVLFSNAGVWEALTKERVMSKEPGLEQHFMTNYMSMVVLCTALKPLLEESAPSRIVITGSFTHMDIVQGKANLDNLQFEDGKVKNQVNNDLAYAQSKLLQYMWAKKFATTVGSQLAVIVYDPGQCETNNDVYKLMKKMAKCCFCLVKKMMGTRKPDDGATIAVWAGDSPDGASANGQYVDFGIFGKLKPRAPVELGNAPTQGKSAESVMDPAQVDRLWNYTQDLLAKSAA